MSNAPSGPATQVGTRWFARAPVWLTNPATLFAVFSLVFGTITLAVTPPLRGPDERAHFVRAYSIAIGEIVPSRRDILGRKGIFVPAFLHDQLSFYEWARHQVGAGGFSFRKVMPHRWDQRGKDGMRDRTPIFFLYDGSEGYSPIPYLPYTLVAVLARAADFDFLLTIYLMRAVGLALWTGVIAYAIATAPALKWAFLLIAMLPSALYGRAIVSADGAVLASTFVVIVLAWRSALGANVRPAARSLSLAVCALTKPPQLAFVLLEPMVTGWRSLPARWRTAALVIAPAMLLAPLWSIISSSDSGSWRYAMESNLAAEQFDPIWKVQFLLAHPLHFPTILIATCAKLGIWFWHQLVGVLGWLDTPLRPSVYPVVTGLLLASWLEPLGTDSALRVRVVVACALTIIAYILATLFVLFIAVTSTVDAVIAGLQGRYFLVVLPLFALMTAAILPRGLPRLAATCAIAGTLISGCAVIEAILRRDWP